MQLELPSRMYTRVVLLLLPRLLPPPSSNKLRDAINAVMRPRSASVKIDLGKTNLPVSVMDAEPGTVITPPIPTRPLPVLFPTVGQILDQESSRFPPPLYGRGASLRRSAGTCRVNDPSFNICGSKGALYAGPPPEFPKRRNLLDPPMDLLRFIYQVCSSHTCTVRPL